MLVYHESAHGWCSAFSVDIVVKGILSKLRKLQVTKIKPDDKFPIPTMDGICLWPKYDCSAPENKKFRSADGSCNNLKYPLRGRALTPFPRITEADYGDGQ